VRDRGPQLPAPPPPLLRPVLAMLAAMAMFAFAAMVIYVFIELASHRAAHAHDAMHPEFNEFYAGLKDNQGHTCCNMQDCHPTQAEIGHNQFGEHVWFAQLALPKDGEWVPQTEWIEIPMDKIIKGPNPTGHPIICHTIAWQINTSHLDPNKIEVRCFLPMDLS
jgi:hypothetical protein